MLLSLGGAGGPVTYADALEGARGAFRRARSALRDDESSGGWDRLLVELPLPPPGCDLQSALRPESDGSWPGGVTQRHRTALRPLADELFRGYEHEYLGTIDVGQMGVWSLSGLTAVGFVADLSFRPFAKLARGGYGDAPTRAGHALLLLNPRLTTADNIGQPWEGTLRREARALVDRAGWRWIYSARPLARADGSLAGTVVATCVDGAGLGGAEGGDDDSRASNAVCTCTPEGRVLSTGRCASGDVRSAFASEWLARARAELRDQVRVDL